MAKIIFGGGVSGIRGTIAGNTFSVNANGAYVRNRGSVANRNSTKQQAVRSILSAVAGSWRSLTDLQKESWQALALVYTYTDRLGISSKLTAFQIYQKFNQQLLQVGLAANDAAPSLQDLGSVVSFAPVYDHGTHVMLLDPVFSLDGSAIVPNDTVCVLDMTMKLSAGVTRPKRPLFRSIRVYAEGVDLATAAGLPQYQETFGYVPELGDTIYCSIKLVSTISGEATVPVVVKLSII